MKQREGRRKQVDKLPKECKASSRNRNKEEEK